VRFYAGYHVDHVYRGSQI